jgi:hypothetical protein
MVVAELFLSATREFHGVAVVAESTKERRTLSPAVPARPIHGGNAVAESKTQDV